MEQDPRVRGQGQEEVWVEAVKARAAAGAGVAVLQPVREAIASAPTVAKKRPMNWEPPAMIRNAPSAAPPWRGNRAALLDYLKWGTGQGRRSIAEEPDR